MLVVFWFIYFFYYSLNLKFFGFGYWIVGFCGMMMMVLCVFGVVIYCKIFVDFFMFCFECRIGCVMFDLYNVVGVFGLLFYVVISLFGLVILFVVYFLSGIWVVYGKDVWLFGCEVYGFYVWLLVKYVVDLVLFDMIVDKVKLFWG